MIPVPSLRLTYVPYIRIFNSTWTDSQTLLSFITINKVLIYADLYYFIISNYILSLRSQT